MSRTALILAGGDALRLRPLTCTKPAAMLPVCGVPLVGYTVDSLKKSGFSRIFIAADRLSVSLTDYLDEEPAADFIISHSPEGTCRVLSETAKTTEDGSFITVIYGNLLFEADIAAAEMFHAESAADVTVITKKAVSGEDSILTVSKDNRISEIIPCPARENCRSDEAAAGIFIISRRTALEAENSGEDILTEFIPALIK